jgi:hypothetical protein
VRLGEGENVCLESRKPENFFLNFNLMDKGIFKEIPLKFKIG